MHLLLQGSVVFFAPVGENSGRSRTGERVCWSQNIYCMVQASMLSSIIGFLWLWQRYCMMGDESLQCRSTVFA